MYLRSRLKKKVGEEERDLPTFLSLPKCPQLHGLVQANANSLKLLGVPPGWQGSGNSGILLRSWGCQQEVEFEAEQLRP